VTLQRCNDARVVTTTHIENFLSEQMSNRRSPRKRAADAGAASDDENRETIEMQTPAPRRGGARPGAGRPFSDDSATRTEPPRAALSEITAENSILRANFDYFKGKRGQAMTYDQSFAALTVIHGLQISALARSDNEAITQAASILGRNHNTLRRLLRYWKEKHEIFVVDTSHRGAGSARHRYHDRQLETEALRLIHTTILNAHNAGNTIRAEKKWQ
jgi:hypothetical protein